MGDPNKTTLVARLSKDGKRVLCDRINCGQTLADAVVNAGMGRVMGFGASGGPWRGFDRKHEGQPREVDPLTVFYRSEMPDTTAPLDDRCAIVFRAGWFPDADGVWTQTKGTQKRYDADREIALGGLGVSARERERAC